SVVDVAGAAHRRGIRVGGLHGGSDFRCAPVRRRGDRIGIVQRPGDAAIAVVLGLGDVAGRVDRIDLSSGGIKGVVGGPTGRQGGQVVANRPGRSGAA